MFSAAASPPVGPAGGVPLRPASTVMVVRDGDHASEPLEVLMVRRNQNANFIGGAYVFPGGRVDPSDGAAEFLGLCNGLTDEAASATLDIVHSGLAFWVAVVRECFEEAGVLLARREGEKSALSMADEADARRFARHRRDLNSGRRQLLDVCREEHLNLAVDTIHYFSNWVTPEGGPRRFDTRFFVAAAPPDQIPAHDDAETVDAVWIRPADAMARDREGDFTLIYPTIRHLLAIERFSTAEELLAEVASAARRPPTAVPKMVVDGRGVRLLLPGDQGYPESIAAGAWRGAELDHRDREVALATDRGSGRS